jgi:hypothetical protein
MNEPRPGLPGPKVSFASHLRWGTEPEGWYVDLPYAVFLVGVNYSPLECRTFNRGAKVVSMKIDTESNSRISQSGLIRQWGVQGKSGSTLSRDRWFDLAE